MSFIVAIDGPSGSGKGTVTPEIAKKFNLMYLDTGATYRCVTLKLLNEKISFDDSEKIEKALDEIKIEFKNYNDLADDKISVDDEKNSNDDKTAHDGKQSQHDDPKALKDEIRVFLDGEDVTKKIREEDVTKNVSQVSHIPEVRKAMVKLQRKMSEGKDVILEGRDIATNVFPNADVKIYLDASFDERVKRRIEQNRQKGIAMSEEDVRENMKQRDYNDEHADIGALKKAEDAIYIDTTNKSIRKTVKEISKIVKKAKKDKAMIASGYVMTEETTGKKIRRKLTKWYMAALYHLVYRIRRSNMDVLDVDEGFIITANHVNFIDSAAIILLNPRPIRFVAKDDLYTHAILNHWGHLFNIIPVKRNSSDIASIKLVLQGLKNKEVIGIFPEGTRHGMDKGSDLKNGAAYMAYKGKVRIIPVGVAGTFKPFTRVYVNYGEPIDVASFKTDDNPNWLDTATEEVMKQVVRLSDINYYKNYKKAERQKKRNAKQLKQDGE